MARETFTKEEFWAELDALGEEEVRTRTFVKHQFGDVGDKRALAEEWLSQKGSERSERSNAEQMRIARSAKNAAWAAAIAAIVAAIAAIASIWITLSF